MTVTHVVGLSGGKDSTAMALRLRELNPTTCYRFVCTPTGNELPEMYEHWNNLSNLLSQPVEYLSTGASLLGLIAKQRAIPNWRMRWCTRLLKIEPFQSFVLSNTPAVTYIGIRADEEGAREGVTNWGHDVVATFPLIEWGWGLIEVVNYLKYRNIAIPTRTDCGLCFFQTLHEWYQLWKNNREMYRKGEELELWCGHSFRSEQRDTHSAFLTELRAEFEYGYVPKPKTMKDRPRMCTTCAR